MNIEAQTATLRQHFTLYELARMPDIVRNSPEAISQTEVDDEKE